jgi:hypothetical protein
MSTHSIRFSGYKGRAEATFTCPSCQKTKRKRTFSVEHTVNPFNKNADGTVKNGMEVSRDAQAAADLRKRQLLGEPLCNACEEALSFSDRIALSKRRIEKVSA